MEDPVVQAAQLAFSVRLKNSTDVSENTKNAQAIAKAWRSAVHALDPDRFEIEASVIPELDQKIDIIDRENGCAYEFKVSGKNAPAEFYKDIVKVIIRNQKLKKKLSSLVFITEEKWGRPFLDAPMPRAYIKYLAELGLKVSVEYVRHEP
jgi:lipid II:glycine glycyltransferase (peptidoglycan interpeptide bridge formation enzyme)